MTQICRFWDSAAGREFVASGASRETSREIMEAIAMVSDDLAEAEEIWERGLKNRDSANVMAFVHMVTGDGQWGSPRDYVWGAAGADWLPPEFEGEFEAPDAAPANLARPSLWMPPAAPKREAALRAMYIADADLRLAYQDEPPSRYAEERAACDGLAQAIRDATAMIARAAGRCAIARPVDPDRLAELMLEALSEAELATESHALTAAILDVA